MSLNLKRFYATDGEREFLVESYILDGQHRVRLSVIAGHHDNSAIGVGETEVDATHAAIDAYQAKFPHLYKDTGNADHAPDPRP